MRVTASSSLIRALPDQGLLALGLPALGLPALGFADRC